MPESPKFGPKTKEEASEAAREQVHAALDSLGSDVLTSRAADIADENTLPPEFRDELQRAEKGDGKLNMFEAIVQLLADLLNAGKDVPEELRDFYLKPEDDAGSDLSADRLTAVQSGQVLDAKIDTPLRKDIVKKALAVVGSTSFRGPEVDGGNLACAQVVSSILRDAGILKRPHLAVSKTVDELNQSGWEEHPGPPQPGDIVVWNRTTKKSADGNVALGHAHIGIVVGDNLALSNSSLKRQPRVHTMGQNPEDGYWHRRGIAKFLRPPHAAQNLVS
ncbi:hypothetical protein COV82_03425 [Candidatus Peregrinibacteria bacterium CG11_big_fil_rev_8_21_14_0_20_46_8]|nr:MAG: hypothetical protein COV82_03425 [Candidatus Peregrinibacteria bacterium CG11_big_fil_rev_8_21_14_0_20_46_8]